MPPIIATLGAGALLLIHLSTLAGTKTLTGDPMLLAEGTGNSVPTIAQHSIDAKTFAFVYP